MSKNYNNNNNNNNDDNNNYYYYYYLTLLRVLTTALVDGFSLESEWQQFSSSLQDSSYYSGES